MRRSLRSWLWRVPLEQEVDEEIAFHVDMRARDLIARGHDPATARQMALYHVGDVRQLKRTCVDIGRKRDRDMRLTQWLQELANDVRFAIRQLRAAPGFTLVATLTLGLGIGANSAMFALADATLMRSMPYAEPDRLVTIWERSATNERSSVSLVNLRDWEERNRSFEAMAAISLGLGGGPVLAAPDGTLESVDRQSVTTRFFEVLGVAPVMGRAFLPEDETSGVNVVVLSERLWRTRFAGDPMLIGREIRLSGVPHTVIGVVPDHVQLMRPASVWTLLRPMPDTQRGLRAWQGLGRLKRGIAVETARADLAVIAEQLQREFPATNKGRSITIESLRAGIMGPDLQLTSILLLGVVGFVLFMCCANVANLLLVRASVRARELALRSALGAGRGRIVRQLLTESLVLAALGSALGIGVGSAILEVAPSLLPAALLPAAVRLTFDGRVVAFCVVAAAAVGVLFGLVPAWHATRASLSQPMASANRSVARSGGRVRDLLAAGQVAAAVLLVCGAGLLLRTLMVVGNFDGGYRADSDSVVTLDFSIPTAGYSTAERLHQFLETVEREASAIPNVRRAGWSTSLPWGNAELGRWRFEIVGDTPMDATSRPSAEYTAANDGYFRALDIPIVAGRGFSDRDTIDATPVCIVDEAFVRRHLGGRDPIGVRIRIQPDILRVPAVREIVGVARQVRGRPDSTQDAQQVYVPLAQVPYDDVYLVIQTVDERPETVVPAIRAAVARLDTNVAVRRIRTVQDLEDEATARYRFRATMVGTFAGLALLLAMIGVFGVLAYAVEQRRREFGVRIALGAPPRHLLQLVMGRAARVIIGGGLIGLTLSAALSQSIATFLFGVRPLDPVTFIAAAGVLALTAVAATLTPALRAMRVDPVVAFRTDL